MSKTSLAYNAITYLCQWRDRVFHGSIHNKGLMTIILRSYQYLIKTKGLMKI